MRLLLDILRRRRPSCGADIDEIIAKYLTPRGVTPDDYGNMILKLGNKPNILFSCHLDTQNRIDGIQRLNAKKNIIRLDDPFSACLGADDGAGIWLMLGMIDAGVEGLYIFHQDEEIGGRGSSFIANCAPELLDGVDFAIAFDRRGKNDIVTHQVGARCCSDTFANSLADILGMEYQPTHGVFTDTANYVDLINECTNISVGYYNEHTPFEVLDTRHLRQLKHALITADYSALVMERDKTHIELYQDNWLDQQPEFWESPENLWGSGNDDTPSCNDYDYMNKYYSHYQKFLRKF